MQQLLDTTGVLAFKVGRGALVQGCSTASIPLGSFVLGGPGLPGLQRSLAARTWRHAADGHRHRGRFRRLARDGRTGPRARRGRNQIDRLWPGRRRDLLRRRAERGRDVLRLPPRHRAGRSRRRRRRSDDGRDHHARLRDHRGGRDGRDRRRPDPRPGAGDPERGRAGRARRTSASVGAAATGARTSRSRAPARSSCASTRATTR